MVRDHHRRESKLPTKREGNPAVESTYPFSAHAPTPSSAAGASRLLQFHHRDPKKGFRNVRDEKKQIKKKLRHEPGMWREAASNDMRGVNFRDVTRLS